MTETGARGLDVFDPSPPRAFRMAAADVLRGLGEGAFRLGLRRPSVPPVIRVEDRFLTGVLDLRAVELNYLLEFVRCRFEEVPDLRQGRLAGVVFSGCRLPGVWGRNLSSANEVSLSGSTVEGLVDLTDADIAGSLVLRDARLVAPVAGGLALHADRVKLAGALLAQGVSVSGELRMAGAQVGGNCNFSSGSLNNPHAHAVNATGVHVGGNLLFNNSTILGTVLLANARVDSALTLRGASVAAGKVDEEAGLDPHADPTSTVVLDRVTVDGDVQLDREFSSAGTVRMVNARLGGTLSLSGGHFDAQDHGLVVGSGDGPAVELDSPEAAGTGAEAGAGTEAGAAARAGAGTQAGAAAQAGAGTQAGAVAQAGAAGARAGAGAGAEAEPDPSQPNTAQPNTAQPARGVSGSTQPRSGEPRSAQPAAHRPSSDQPTESRPAADPPGSAAGPGDTKVGAVGDGTGSGSGWAARVEAARTAAVGLAGTVRARVGKEFGETAPVRAESALESAGGASGRERERGPGSEAVAGRGAGARGGSGVASGPRLDRLMGDRQSGGKRVAEPIGFGRALHLDGAQVGGDVVARQAFFRGQIRMVDLQVKGSLTLDGSALDNPRADAVLGNRSHIGSNLTAREVEVTGGLELRGVQIGANLDLRGSRITQPGRYRHMPAGKPSLDVGGGTIGRDLICAGGAKEFVAHGGVRARRAQVGRMANFNGAVLGDKLDSHALNALGLQVQELVLTPVSPPRGDVTLRQVRCTSLDDNETFWSATGWIDLEEFRYDSLRNPIDLRDDDEVDRRLRWLRQAMRRSYRPGPYDQFAEMLRACGNDEHAATVLVEKQRLRYRAVAEGRRWLRPLVLLWSWLQRSMVGYGYRPARALAWLVVSWVLGSVWFSVGPPLEVINSDDRLPWNPWLFTIDLVVPIVDFGNKNRWQLAGASQWIGAGLIVTGWVLATTVAAGLTRMLKR
ncbi:hypothetical protein AB0A74_26915 [Saccharothrix sp. NPDC042600]|uniref:hypothetical protein n=1 Tax=Saccharothrix TaxID=2071 RepID=UPI0033F58806|nr:hypothetical protein GCM10017745_08000 [Saccharothrix mutabilis subsp. capreolus]